MGFEPTDGLPRHGLSRAAHSTRLCDVSRVEDRLPAAVGGAKPLLHMLLITRRRARDSNPRWVAPQRFSRPSHSAALSALLARPVGERLQVYAVGAPFVGSAAVVGATPATMVGMDAITITAECQLELTTAPDPSPGTGEVLVEVAAAGINRADLLQRAGHYPPPPGESEILGLEVSGTITALGPEVTGWQVGDEVCALLAGEIGRAHV